MKIIILVLCAVLSVAKGNYEERKLIHVTDEHLNYINMNRRQQLHNLKDYDDKLNHYEEKYLGSLEALSIQSELLTADLVEAKHTLGPLEVLGGRNKHCVNTYSNLIPNVADTRMEINSCALRGRKEIIHSLNASIAIRNTLEQLHKTDFEEKIESCYHNSREMDYTKCIILAARDFNAYCADNKKAFDTHLDVAKCIAKSAIKKALDCSYSIQNNAIVGISRARLLIDRCINPDEHCEPCDTSNTCPHTVDLQIDHTEDYIKNPFYGNPHSPHCLMINIKKHEHKFLN